MSRGLVDWAVAEAQGRAGAGAAASVLRAHPSVVVAAGDVVVKVHEPGTDAGALARRLEAAQDLAGDGLLLAPALARPLAVPDAGRWATVWPRVEPLAGGPQDVPWAAAGALLARLHGVEPEPGLPGHGAPGRFRRDLEGMEAALAGLAASGAGPAPGAAVDDVLAAADVVRGAASSLDGRAGPPGPGRPVRVVHGDFHLGQVARRPGPDGAWLLIDVDDLGAGDPVSDLARPAAFWACGLLGDEHWALFLAGYRAARNALDPGGDAFGLGAGPDADPWPVLDPVARPCVVQTAAAAVRRAAERLTPSCAPVDPEADPATHPEADPATHPDAGPAARPEPTRALPGSVGILAGPGADAGLDEVDRLLLAACGRIASAGRG